jgi:hypothetical protein
MQVFIVALKPHTPGSHFNTSQAARVRVATATYTLVLHRATLNIMTIDSICMTAL